MFFCIVVTICPFILTFLQFYHAQHHSIAETGKTLKKQYLCVQCLHLQNPNSILAGRAIAQHFKKYEFSWQRPLWESHGIHQTESRLQICEYWKGLYIYLIHSVLRNSVSQKEQFSPLGHSSFDQHWMAFCGPCAEISIESWWVCSHIKLRCDLEQNVMDAKTQFDMAVNPLWFNINLKTSAKTWHEHCGSSLLECTFLWVLFLWIILTKLRWIRAREGGL